MIRVYNDFRSYKVREKFIDRKQNGQKLFLSSGIMYLSFVQGPTDIVDGMQFLIFTLS